MSYIEQHDIATAKVADASEVVELYAQAKAEVLAELEAGPVCPTCGQPIPEGGAEGSTDVGY